jgi:hypothetical protein
LDDIILGGTPASLARKIAAAKKEAVKARAGKARQSKFAVRFFVKKSSDFVQQTPPIRGKISRAV